MNSDNDEVATDDGADREQSTDYTDDDFHANDYEEGEYYYENVESEEEDFDAESELNEQVVEPIQSTSQNSDLQKSCWVCLGSESDDRTAEWVQPCRCRGATKWVHHSCLMRWVDEKQKGHSFTKVACPQCKTEYTIIFPPFGKFCGSLQTVDRLIYKASPFVASGVLLGTLYWTAVTYGAITVMQVLGHKEGLDVMERADPLFLLIGLPAIPASLVLGKMIQWDEYLLRWWRRHAHKYALLNYVFPRTEQSPRRNLQPQEAPAREIKFTRVFCGAMFFPTVATLFGKLLYRHVRGNLQRSALGGFTFVIAKGILKIYLKQQVYTRLGTRKIADFGEGAGQS